MDGGTDAAWARGRTLDSQPKEPGDLSGSRATVPLNCRSIVWAGVHRCRSDASGEGPTAELLGNAGAWLPRRSLADGPPVITSALIDSVCGSAGWYPRRRLGAVAQSGSAPRSQRGGQGFKSPQLHSRPYLRRLLEPGGPSPNRHGFVEAEWRRPQTLASRTALRSLRCPTVLRGGPKLVPAEGRAATQTGPASSSADPDRRLGDGDSADRRRARRRSRSVRPRSPPQGFAADHSWIDLQEAKDGRAYPARTGRDARARPYMLGLTWQHTRGSALLGWVGSDAAFLAEQIARR